MNNGLRQRLSALAALLSGLGILFGAGCASPQIFRLSPMMQKMAVVPDRPPADKALVCIHRPRDFRGESLYSNIWDGDRFIGDLGSGHSIAYVCEPGKHYFISRSLEVVSVVEAELINGKTYDLWLDTAGTATISYLGGKPLSDHIGGLELKPVKQVDKQRGQVAEWSKENFWVERGEHAAHFSADYEQKYKIEIEKIVHDFTVGDNQDRLQRLTTEDCRSPEQTGAGSHEQHASIPMAESDMNQEQLIRNLDPANSEGVIIGALVDLERSRAYDASPAMKKLLTDPRASVRKKAAHAVGKLHLDVDESDIKALCAMFRANDPNEVEASLKALRDLDAPSAVPEILPLLKSDRGSNIREACRTLAVLANKDVIPAIEPLLQHPDAAVQKDAKNTIAKLRAKP